MNDDDDFSQILDQITLPADEELWMDDSFPHYMQQQMTMKYGSVENILIILSRRCHLIVDLRMGKLIIDVDHKEEALRVQITTPLVAINCPPKAILVMLMTITVMTGVTNFDEDDG